MCKQARVCIMYYSAIKLNSAICNNTDGPRDYHIKQMYVRKRNTNTIYHLYVESKIQYKSIYLQNKNRLVGIEICGCLVKRLGEGKEWKCGISTGKLLYIGWISNKVLLYSTGTIFNIL